MVQLGSLLEQVIDSQKGNLAPELARYILSLDFPPAARARYTELAYKVQEGALSPQEKSELESFIAVNAFLSVVQSKARVSLRNNKPAA